MWDPAVYRLMREFRVIAFDNRGMGESDKPGGPYDFGVLAADLGFVLETLGAGDVTLVGWSMGCTISLEYLSRGGGRVGRLVLMNGPLKLTQTPEFPWTMSEEQLRGYLDDLGARWPDSEEDFSRGALRDPDSAYADLYYQVALQTPLELAMRIVDEQVKIDHIPVLPTLQMPVLAAYGRYDPYYPIALAEFIAERAPRAEATSSSRRAPTRRTTRSPTASVEVIRDFTLRTMSGVFHAASIEVAVPAETAFAYLSDGLKQGEWTLGSWNRERIGEQLFQGTSLFDGAETFVRITARSRARCSSTTRSARHSTGCSASTPPASFPGRSSGVPEGTCVVTLMKWRVPSEDDARWRQRCVTFDTEIHMIKGRLELGF